MATPAFLGQTRRQAPPHCRAAADQDSCERGINRLRFPPHPPMQGLRRFLGQAGKVGGAGGNISVYGSRGVRLESVDGIACNYHLPYSTKRRAAFARLNIPRNRVFVPRFGLFLPHLPFCWFTPPYLSIYLFSEREEGKEGGGSQNRPSTNERRAQNVYPRIFRVSTGFWWMADRAAGQCWCGFACIRPPIHQSTCGNVPGGAANDVLEVAK